MSRIMFGFIVVTGLTLLGSAAHAGCSDPRVATVRAQIDSECPCTGNHGQFVSCVAHHVRDAVRNHDLDTNCKGAVTRCAARSTCGKKVRLRDLRDLQPGHLHERRLRRRRDHVHGQLDVSGRGEPLLDEVEC